MPALTSSFRSRSRSRGRRASPHPGDPEPGSFEGSEAEDFFPDECAGSSGASSGSRASTSRSSKTKAAKAAKAKQRAKTSAKAAKGAKGAAGAPTTEEPGTPTTAPSEPGVMAATDDDGQQAADLQLKMTSHLVMWRIGAVVGVSVLVAWLIGAVGLSLAWLLLLLAALGTAWPSLPGIVADAVRRETVRVRVRRALCQDETAEWFNFLLHRWWTFSSNSLLTTLKERLEPLLNEARPSIAESLELRELCLGSKTPLLTGLRATDLVAGRCVPFTLSSLLGGPGLQGPASGRAGSPPLAPCHRVALRADVQLEPSDDFRCVLRARIRGVGVDMEMAIEKLHLSGTVLATLTLDINAPFPHITHLSIAFVEKPDIWFSVRVLKAVQAMEVPLLKTWIHSLVLDALMTTLVDPGHLDFVLMSPDCPRPAKEATDNDSLACGVLTLTLSSSLASAASQGAGGAGSGPDEGGARWLVLTLGSQRRTCQLSAQSAQSASESVSFLVSAAQLQPSATSAERLQVKLKAKRLVGALTLAQYELPLSAYVMESAYAADSPSDGARSSLVVDTVLRKVSKASSLQQAPNINVRLEYTPLPPMQANQPELPMSNGTDSLQGGVLHVVIHGAEGLSPSDQNECNPYCMIFNNRQKVKTTHYMRGTTSPAWESRTQLLVSDFSQTSLSFVVCSWSSAKMADTDLLGVAVLNMANTERRLAQRHLALTGNSAAANITVSVAFQPVASVSVSNSISRLGTGSLHERDRQRPASPDQRNIDDFSTFTRGKRNSNTWMHQAKMLLTHKDNDTSVSDISNLLSNGQGLIEVSFFRARNLVAKDLNGFSDPYCEVKVNGECKYKTSIQKKTLNPVWEESTITGMPNHSEILEILIWDHDIFGMKDFLGSITFTCDEIRRCSAIDAPQWFQLQNTKSGSVEIKMKVISDMEMESCSSYAPSTAPSVNSCTSSPRLPIKTESDRDSNYSFKPIIRRPSMERSRLKLHVDPPPPPPRTVTLQHKGTNKEAPNSLVGNANSTETTLNSSEINLNKVNGNGVHNQLSGSMLANGSWSPVNSATSSPLPVPRLLVTSPHSSAHSSPGRFSLRSHKPPLSGLSPSGTHSGFEANDESPFKKGNEYSSLRIMKQKVKQGLRLRRFRSEINFYEEKNGKNSASGITLQPRSAEEADESEMLHGEPLSHAVSQPSLFSSKPKRPTDLKGLASPRPDTYVGVEGKVLQAQGLHVAHVAQLYCRVKLQTVVSPEKQTRLSSNSATGKTVGKSRLLPAVPNPRFDLHFQLDSSSPIPRQAALLFEIRSASKDIVASRRITLQDLLSAAAPDTNEVHTWLALNNGASVEVEVAHGRELKKPARKIFRSWSVHRIGKI